MATLEKMHADALRTRPGFVKLVEKELKLKISEMCDGARVSVVSRALLTYPPQSPSTIVYLEQVFPVLHGAEVMPLSKEVEQGIEAGSVVFFRQMRTVNHGIVFVFVLGWKHLDAADAALGMADGADGLCICLESGLSGSTFLQSLALVSMVFIRPRCSGCHALEGEVKIHANFILTRHSLLFFPQSQRFLRCARCWERLRFPVWYCCRSCQVADYGESHQPMCGKITK